MFVRPDVMWCADIPVTLITQVQTDELLLPSYGRYGAGENDRWAAAGRTAAYLYANRAQDYAAERPDKVAEQGLALSIARSNLTVLRTSQVNFFLVRPTGETGKDATTRSQTNKSSCSGALRTVLKGAPSQHKQHNET